MKIDMHLSLRRPIIGGIIFALLMGFCTFTFGKISGFQARDLLSTSMSGINTLCYVIILGSIYILVMTLYLLRLNLPKISEIRHKHYYLLLTIARIDTILIVMAIIILLLLNIPFTETEAVPDSWYIYIYYSILIIASVLGGGFITVVTMIYQTISNLIHEKFEHYPLNESEVERTIESEIEKKEISEEEALNSQKDIQ